MKLCQSLRIDDNPIYAVLSANKQNVISYHNVFEHAEHNANIVRGPVARIRYRLTSDMFAIPVFPPAVAVPNTPIAKQAIDRNVRIIKKWRFRHG